MLYQMKILSFVVSLLAVNQAAIAQENTALEFNSADFVAALAAANGGILTNTDPGYILDLNLVCNPFFDPTCIPTLIPPPENCPDCANTLLSDLANSGLLFSSETNIEIDNTDYNLRFGTAGNSIDYLSTFTNELYIPSIVGY